MERKLETDRRPTCEGGREERKINQAVTARSGRTPEFGGRAGTLEVACFRYIQIQGLFLPSVVLGSLSFFFFLCTLPPC
jgi:hypothetical protein